MCWEAGWSMGVNLTVKIYTSEGCEVVVVVSKNLTAFLIIHRLRFVLYKINISSFKFSFLFLIFSQDL